MKIEDVTPIPVIRDNTTRRLIGIVTDRDLALKVVAEALNATTTTVDEVMTASVFACRANDDLQSALDIMEEQEVRRVPVVDDEGHIVGIITHNDVVQRTIAAEAVSDLIGRLPTRKAAGCQ